MVCNKNAFLSSNNETPFVWTKNKKVSQQLTFLVLFIIYSPLLNSLPFKILINRIYQSRKGSMNSFIQYVKGGSHVTNVKKLMNFMFKADVWFCFIMVYECPSVRYWLGS